MQTTKFKFASTCATCGGRITGNGNWRHDNRPADKHWARPTGVMRQI